MLRILFCFRLFVFFVKNLFILLLNERKYGSLVCCTVQNDVIYDKNITGMSSSTVSSSSHLADIVSTKATFISGTVLLDQLALDLGTKVIPLILHLWITTTPYRGRPDTFYTRTFTLPYLSKFNAQWVYCFYSSWKHHTFTSYIALFGFVCPPFLSSLSIQSLFIYLYGMK